MAVKKEASIERYIGLAADTKPTGVPPGSTFLAYDSDELYITYDDGTNWVLKDLLVRLIASPAAIGKLAANSGVDIGDVDVTSEPSGSGSYTTATHTTLNVTTNTQAALAANANRLYALLVNDSDTTIYIKIAAAAVANQGIRLNANGGSYEISKKLGNLNTGAINAIHGGSGNKVLLITEGV